MFGLKTIDLPNRYKDRLIATLKRKKFGIWRSTMQLLSFFKNCSRVFFTVIYLRKFENILERHLTAVTNIFSEFNSNIEERVTTKLEVLIFNSTKLSL